MHTKGDEAMTPGFLLMSGGLSSRMGTPKALLALHGQPLLMHIARAGKPFAERILSVNDDAIPTPEGYLRIGDVYRECGPMGGLHAALTAAQSDALVVVPCDAPHFTAEAAAFLASQYSDEYDAVILEDENGRAHPMMGVYAKSCLPALTKHLEEKRFKLMMMLSGLRVRRVRLPESIPQRVMSNLNTPEDYEALCRETLAGDVRRIAREAGRIIRSAGSYDVEQKEGHANFVTSVDMAVQEYLSAALREALPGSRLIGEEQENDALTGEPTWIIDPVDGTTNLIHDYRQSAVSIALCRDGAPVMAAVYQPYTDEMFFAEKGCGATLNGKPIHSAQHPFERALVAFGTSPYNAALAERSMKLALTFLQNCADIRRSGSAAIDLANVACGRVDLFFELVLQPWDYAAGALLVTEAGGRFMMPFGEGQIRFDKPQGILAVSETCAEKALSHIRHASD